MVSGYLPRYSSLQLQPLKSRYVSNKRIYYEPRDFVTFVYFHLVALFHRPTQIRLRPPNAFALSPSALLNWRVTVARALGRVCSISLHPLERAMKAKTLNCEQKKRNGTFSPVANKHSLRRAHEGGGVSASDFGEVAIVAGALGVQLLIEMRDCLTERLDDLDWVKGVMTQAALRAKATIVQTVFHKFNPIGISGIVVIAESHLAIHIWPEYKYAAVDIFSCGRTLRAAAAGKFLIKQFRSLSPEVIKMQRGLLTPRQKTRGIRSA